MYFVFFCFFLAVLWLIICSLTSFVVELPVLDNELYHAVKPGLSAYKDNPEEVCMLFKPSLINYQVNLGVVHCHQTPGIFSGLGSCDANTV